MKLLSILAVWGASTWLAPAALACVACFGRSDSSLAQGMNMGIFTLLAVVVFMWAGFGAFFIYLARRASSSRKSVNSSSEPTVSSNQ